MRISGWIGGATGRQPRRRVVPGQRGARRLPVRGRPGDPLPVGALILTVLLKGRLGRPTPKEFALLFARRRRRHGRSSTSPCSARSSASARPTPAWSIGACPVVLALLVPLIARRGQPPLRHRRADRRRRRRDRQRHRRPPQRARPRRSRSTALAGEVGFTLLAAPLLPRLGPMRVAAWAALARHRAARRPQPRRHPDAHAATTSPRSPTSR